MAYSKRQTGEQRFASHITRTEFTDCWIWSGFRNPLGYGIFINHNQKILAHRYSYQLAYGTFKSQLCVCHKCDIPSCVNPEHLFLGTRKDNLADMVAKGRQRYRTMQPNIKSLPNLSLRREMAKSIREEYTSCLTTYKKLAIKYGVSRETIRRIVVGIGPLYRKDHVS